MSSFMVSLPPRGELIGSHCREGRAHLADGVETMGGKLFFLDGSNPRGVPSREGGGALPPGLASSVACLSEAEIFFLGFSYVPLLKLHPFLERVRQHHASRQLVPEVFLSSNFSLVNTFSLIPLNFTSRGHDWLGEFSPSSNLYTQVDVCSLSLSLSVTTRMPSAPSRRPT